jgi:fucose 4-O-acetylase-like acetyltransferase
MKYDNGVSRDGGRMRYIDGAKGFALICVMLGHTAGGVLVSYIDNFLLPVFWVAAGFTSRPDFSLRRRFKSLVVPYAVMSLVCLLFTAVRSHFSIEWPSIAGIFYSRYCLFPFDESGPHFVMMNLDNSVLWFLTSLFTAYCLFRVILCCGDALRQGMACVVSVACGFIYPSLPILLPWSMDTAFFIAPMMWCGHLLRRYGILERYGWQVLLVTVPVYALLNYFSGPTNYSVREMGWHYPASFGCAVAGAVAMLVIFRYLERTYMCRAFAFVNAKALYVFGLQLIFISVAAYFCGYLRISMWPTVACQILLATAGGYAAGVIAGRLVQNSEAKWKRILGKSD